ncbi:MAG: NAD(P)-dependent alcohol dehydrogenase [Firmicutes bacterium]|nr:NAD(P)-dependent alcohol dehydrogenase [Bacillota bacterium]
MKIKAYAALKPNQPLEPFEYEPKELGPLDVEIRITHCGVCHTDLHIIEGTFGPDVFPVVPGHEIAGFITETGKDVKRLKAGDRVGVGWQRGSCMECEWCVSGQENLCASNQATCVGHFGGFADAIRIDSRFVFPIPGKLASPNAASLLCGGATVFSPLQQLARPTMRAGVIGIGGLGHFALQFARAFGCEVTAFSTTPGKEQEAKNLGAHNFVVTKDEEQMKKAAGSLDLIISTVNVNLNWGEYLNVLRPNGSLVLVGLVQDNLSIPTFPLILGQKSVKGSVIGSIHTINEMLDFAARHDIKAMIETMPMDKVNEAIEKTKSNKARYRMVLENKEGVS